MLKTLPLILLLTAVGCSRLELARDQLLSQIDTLLGETEAKSRQATVAVDQLTQAVAPITRARIDVQARFRRIAEDIDAVEQRLSRTQDGPSRQSLQSEAESLRTTRDRLGRVLGLLQHREQQARDRLQGLRLLLSRISDKQVALRALRKAVEVSEGIDFRSAETEIRELETAIDAELRFQKLRFDDLTFDLSGD